MEDPGRWSCPVTGFGTLGPDLRTLRMSEYLSQGLRNKWRGICRALRLAYVRHLIKITIFCTIVFQDKL